MIQIYVGHITLGETHFQNGGTYIYTSHRSLKKIRYWKRCLLL